MTHKLFILICLICCSCSTKKDLSKGDSKESDTQSIRYLFFSRGSGIDGKTKKEFADFEETFRKENNIKQPPTIIRKGKEGETIYCYEFTGWKKELKNSFLQKSAEILSKSKLVRTEINIRCDS